MLCLSASHPCAPAARPRGSLPRLHLASNSPRRRELLAAAGLDHDAAHPGVDDGLLSRGQADPARWVMALAYLKAASAMHAAQIAAPVVLGADTIVVHGDRTFGQPSDGVDARHMLVAMRNATHDVLTGVALIHVASGRRDLFVDRATVTVGDVPDAEIDAYVAGGQWRGKAGAYNLSERLSAGWPVTFTGDAGTIMGLPIALLTARLRRFA